MQATTSGPTEDDLLKLAREVIRVLDKRCKVSPDDTWTGYENANGYEVGSDIEKLIKRAKRTLNRHASPKRRTD